MTEKRAKILNKNQEQAILNHLQNTRHPERDKAMFLFSAKAGMRAMEIAGITWDMVTDPQGNISDTIALAGSICKRKKDRALPIHKDLKNALEALRNASNKNEQYIIISERGDKLTQQGVYQFFKAAYSKLGFAGCSSHSGRRTAITRMAINATTAGASLKDVQILAGHNDLKTTLLYIEGSSEAQKRLVDLI